MSPPGSSSTGQVVSQLQYSTVISCVYSGFSSVPGRQRISFSLPEVLRVQQPSYSYHQGAIQTGLPQNHRGEPVFVVRAGHRGYDALLIDRFAPLARNLPIHASVASAGSKYSSVGSKSANWRVLHTGELHSI